MEWTSFLFGASFGLLLGAVVIGGIHLVLLFRKPKSKLIQGTTLRSIEPNKHMIAQNKLLTNMEITLNSLLMIAEEAWEEKR